MLHYFQSIGEEDDMSSERAYKVVLKDKTELSIRADDVELDGCDDAERHCPTHFYNFIKYDDPEDRGEGGITVAVIPHDQVLSINS
jgi:hypothetical protein